MGMFFVKDKDLLAENVGAAFRELNQSRFNEKRILKLLEEVVNHDFSASSWAREDKILQGKVADAFVQLKHGDGTPEFVQGIRRLQEVAKDLNSTRRISL